MVCDRKWHLCTHFTWSQNGFQLIKDGIVSVITFWQRPVSVSWQYTFVWFPGLKSPTNCIVSSFCLWRINYILQLYKGFGSPVPDPLLSLVRTTGWKTQGQRIYLCSSSFCKAYHLTISLSIVYCSKNFLERLHICFREHLVWTIFTICMSFSYNSDSSNVSGVEGEKWRKEPLQNKTILGFLC